MIYVDMVIMSSVGRSEEFPIDEIIRYHRRLSGLYSSKHFQRDQRLRNTGHYDGERARIPKHRRNKHFKPPTKDFTFQYLAFPLRRCPAGRARDVLPGLEVPYGYEVNVPLLTECLRRASNNMQTTPRGDFWIPLTNSTEDR